MMRTSSEKISQRGFTLIEALVALLVLSVGLLGIASLYVVSLKSGSSAIYRMQAINLASDLADRIRANPGGAAAYAGAGADNACLGATQCSPADMAAYDLFLWQKDVSNVLPGGTAPVVTYTPGPPDSYSITVSWSDRDPKAKTAVVLSYVLTVQI